MKKKILALSLALGAFALILSAGTMAYFTDRTDVIKNTFTVGSVDITLDEGEIDPTTNKFKAGGARVQANTYEKIVPGTTVDKDPTVTNVGKSDAWVRVKLANKDTGNGQADWANIGSVFQGVVDSGYSFPTSVTSSNINKVLVGFDTSKWDMKQTKYVFNVLNPTNMDYELTFTYKTKLAPEETAKLFDGIKVATSVEHLTDFGIDLTAEAVQADGFETAEAAFAATFDAE